MRNLIFALTDIDGSARVYGGAVDIGAYEVSAYVEVSNNGIDARIPESWLDRYPSLLAKVGNDYAPASWDDITDVEDWSRYRFFKVKVSID